MQTFEQWWNDEYVFASEVKEVCFDETRYIDFNGKEHSFHWSDISEWGKEAAMAAHKRCEKQYEHKIKNIEQAKNLRIQVLEKLLEELRKDFELLAQSRIQPQK